MHRFDGVSTTHLGKLGTQISDVAVNGSVRDVDICRPSQIQQLLAGKSHSGAGKNRMQDIELYGCELERQIRKTCLTGERRRVKADL